MSQIYNPYFKPGFLEVFCGPMNCGKSRELVNIIDRLNYMAHYPYMLVKSQIDTRSAGIKTRFGNLELRCHRVSKAEEIPKLLTPEHRVIGIEEVQFLDESIVPIVKKMVKNNIYVICTGLDLDFRGEPFGIMPQLLSIADAVHKLTAVCDYNDGKICGSPATRTQRLINGQPADYNSPIILVGDKKEGYHPRCLRHHYVPGKI
jgi:thymidine kinase